MAGSLPNEIDWRYTFINNLERLSHYHGFSQKELAYRAGMSYYAICAIFAETRGPYRDEAIGLGRALGVAPEAMEILAGYLPESLCHHHMALELITRLACLPKADYWAMREALRDCVVMMPKPQTNTLQREPRNESITRGT